MAKNLALGVVIGASLSGGFHSAIGGARDKFNTLGKEIESLSGQRKLIEKFEADQASLEKTRLELGKTQKQVGKLKLALRKDPADEGTAKALAQTQAKAEKLSASVDKQRSALDRSRRAMSQAGVRVGKLSGEYGRLGRSLDDVRAKHGRMQRQMERKSAAGARLREMRGQIAGVAGALYTAGRMIGQAADFEQAEVRLSTVLNTDNLPGDIAAARQHALDFARKGLSSETQMLDIQYALNSAGLDAGAARAGSEIVAKVAKVTDGAAEGVGEVIATTFNNLGASLEGSTQERLTRIGELLTKTQFKFQIRNFDQLGESLKYATPSLAQFGVELDQGLTLLGALNSAGMQGSMAGTSLAATFRQLGKASEEFGFEIVRGADGNMDFIATLENLSDSIGGFEGLDQETIDRLQKAFGEEGQRGVVLLGRKLKELRAAQDDVAQGSKGLVDESYQRFLESTSGQLTVLTNNLRIVGTTFAGTLLPAINSVVKPLASVAQWAGALIERFPWIGRLIGGVVAGIGTFVIGLTAVTAATWLWNAALLANPIGLVVAAVVGAVAAIVTFWEPITDFFKGLWGGIKEIFTDGVKFLTKVWEMSPLGLLFKAGNKLAGFVGGLFGGDDPEKPSARDDRPEEAEKPRRSGRLAKAAGAAAVGATLAAAPVAAEPVEMQGLVSVQPVVQPVRMPEMQGRVSVQPVVQPVRMPEMQGSARVQPVVQPVRMPEMQGRAIVEPMMQPAHGGSERVEHSTTINAPITVNAAPGMSEKDLAREVSRALDERERQAQARRRGRLYD
jgi:TP901 family phage tail tape measure protein